MEETVFESLVSEIKGMEPSWDRTDKIDYLINAMNEKPGILKRALKAWPFLESRNIYSGELCHPEDSEDYLEYNSWTFWDRSGWEKIWKRFIIEVGIHYEEMAPEAKKNFAIFDTKEKYGTLRVSLSGYDEKLFELESMLEELSSVTCMHCGKQPRDSRGTSVIWATTGWITTLCKDCLRKDYFAGSSKNSKERHEKEKKRFKEYAKERKSTVPYFASQSWRKNNKKFIFRKPAYGWVETYKVEEVWDDGE